MPVFRMRWFARAAAAYTPRRSVNSVRRPVKRFTAATAAVNPLITLNVFEVAMTTFHSLTVAKVEPETRDAVTITFAIPDALQAEYAFRPGQHLTVKARLGGKSCAAATPSVAAARRRKSAWRSKPSTADVFPAMRRAISAGHGAGGDGAAGAFRLPAAGRARG